LISSRAGALLLSALVLLALPDSAATRGAGPARAYCGGASPRAAGGAAVALKVTPAITAQLRRRLLTCYRGPDAGRIKGPLVGKVHLARYGGSVWAVATFSFPATGTTDQPERFIHKAGPHRWRDLGDTGGPLSDRVPCAVLRAWHIRCS
jgi:hypothetical protein